MLEAIVADRNRPQKHVERARVVLAAAERGPVQPMATRLGISRPMVWRWQQRFAEEGAGGLLRDKTRKPGKPRFTAVWDCAILSACASLASRRSRPRRWHASWR